MSRGAARGQGGDPPARFPAAPLDRPTRLVTLGTSLLIALGIPLLAGGEEPLAAAVLWALGFGIVLGAFGWSPAAYELDGELVRVRRRLFGTVERRLTGPVLRAPWTLGFGGVRLGGSGGLFGWSGPFYKPEIGRYRAYLTDRSRIVACPTEGGLIAISPADPDAFVAAASRRRP